jgi:hypothetical protein
MAKNKELLSERWTWNVLLRWHMFNKSYWLSTEGKFLNLKKGIWLIWLYFRFLLRKKTSRKRIFIWSLIYIWQSDFQIFYLYCRIKDRLLHRKNWVNKSSLILEIFPFFQHFNWNDLQQNSQVSLIWMELYSSFARNWDEL